MTTKTNIALRELAEKGADDDLLRPMIQYVAQRLMELDVEGLCAATYGERSPERLNSRNGDLASARPIAQHLAGAHSRGRIDPSSRGVAVLHAHGDATLAN